MMLAAALAGILATGAAAEGQLPDCKTALKMTTVNGPDLNFLVQRADEFGTPELQRLAREVAEELKDEQPSLNAHYSLTAGT